MTKANHGDTVRLHYSVLRRDGRIFASTKGREPIEVTIGNGKLIPGFEEGVIGMEVGERKTLGVPPERAFGPWLGQLVIGVAKEEFPGGEIPEIGEQLNVQKEDGSVLQATVIDISEDAVWIDTNHPLAGETLTFDIQLIEVTQS
jgi:peptidylprolyl isomerase